MTVLAEEAGDFTRRVDKMKTRVHLGKRLMRRQIVDTAKADDSYNAARTIAKPQMPLGLREIGRAHV